MPFMYKSRITNINRSNKRPDDFIHAQVLRILGNSPCIIPILPSDSSDPTFSRAERGLFLVVDAVKEVGLSWFEVEHWLDRISSRNRYMFYLETGSIRWIDERRRYYADINRMPRSNLIYRPV